jgi:hypothetical protein
MLPRYCGACSDVVKSPSDARARHFGGDEWLQSRSLPQGSVLFVSTKEPNLTQTSLPGSNDHTSMARVALMRPEHLRGNPFSAVVARGAKHGFCSTTCFSSWNSRRRPSGSIDAAFLWQQAIPSAHWRRKYYLLACDRQPNTARTQISPPSPSPAVGFFACPTGLADMGPKTNASLWLQCDKRTAGARVPTRDSRIAVQL